MESQDDNHLFDQSSIVIPRADGGLPPMSGNHMQRLTSPMLQQQNKLRKYTQDTEKVLLDD